MQQNTNQDPMNREPEQVETENNIEEIKKALADEKAKSESYLGSWQRAQADFINYKRYAEQEKATTCELANAGLLCVILPVLDDLERALAAIPQEQERQKWVEGIKLIDRKLRDTLEKQGVTCIKTLGEEFTPQTMEAMSTGKGKKDIVILELEKGYKLHDKVIRPAKVIVGSGEEEADKEE